MSEVTRILTAIEQGDPLAPDQLLPLVYDELRKLAAAKLAEEKPGQTLEATALVHEAYLRLVTPPRSASAEEAKAEESQWDSRRHFFAAAAEAMRRILIDAARRKGTEKHGGQRQRINLENLEIAETSHRTDLLAVDEALTKFAKEDPIKAQLVTLRYFAGLSVQEAADALGISRATADRYWAYARTWLFCELGGKRESPHPKNNPFDA